MFYIYILKSQKNNKTYVGFTEKDPKLRLDEHNNGSNQFTRYNKPWVLIYYETYSCMKCARIREKFYKTGIGKKIKQLIVKNLFGV